MYIQFATFQFFCIFVLQFAQRGCKIGLADVVKLVDTLDLGSSAERCAGSSPSIRTFRSREFGTFFFNIKLKII